MNGGNLRRRPERFCFLPDGEDETVDEINILSILKIQKQSLYTIFAPDPSASDQISPPKKKKRHGKRRSENAVLPSGLFPM